MKTVITDYTFPDLGIESGIIEAAGHELTGWKGRRTPTEVRQMVADADAVITQFAPVNAEVISAMSKTRVIVRYGIGVDNVDLEAARARGIP
ncbi:MAG: D-3-phosphoglycerate dehydrogenase, partial [Planctomycetota bacterium]